ncbi:phosphate ABC transporter permease [Nocardioides sp. Root122]|uniref:phosphate ABC transporter permease PstA n=1 Tax=Nocardioides TaxID=1839 RepID=UPI000703999E|nr:MULTISPECIES: phosphate ABC transporter permease PstA [Nocardioides]KQV77694.1 phosphate ABC transporter permease [Nocardioides sp. Root122]MCK9822153.1 phosphate ABC transporter permease PstA [Nocardioides cavernae]
MSVTTAPVRTAPEAVSFTAARLPRIAPALVAVVAVAAAALPVLLLGWGPVAWAILSALVFLVALPVWAGVVEGRRGATDRLMTGLVWTACAIAVVPLASLLWTVVDRGLPRISSTFLTFSMYRTSLDQEVGIYHALIGTLLITIGAAVISVPIGIMAAIYLIEYGKGSRLAGWITFLVDVMTGIPSIVAGLFAFSVFILLFGPSYRSGIGGSVALSLLMIPVVVRSTEEMLRLVPADLREASYALGVPKWRTIVKVVLPTALGGIVTGVTLAIARVVGETAPLLLIAGLTTRTNFNLFDGRMTTLPVLIYTQNANPGIAETPGGTPPGVEIAWGAALVLIVIVMLLNLVARVIGRIFAPKTGH